jgi:hypothetical protein
MSMTSRRTPVLLTVITIALFASARADAATITFSQDFSVSSHDEFPAFPDEQGPALRFLSDWGFASWMVPPFDPALGTPEFVEYKLTGVVTISGRLAFGDLFAVITLANPFDNGFLGVAGVSANCGASECAFSHAEVVGTEMPLAYHIGEPIFDWPLTDSPDREAIFELPAWAIVDTSYVGTATATYHYDPVPEPTTGLLLVTGLTMAGLVRRHPRS